MTSDEVLAVCRIRQWAQDRMTLKSGRVTDLMREGWRERQTRLCDARIVRVLDFERALSRLTPEHQALLLMTYRDHLDQRAAAEACGVSLRALAYKLPAARQALAAALDSLDLL